VKFISKKFRPLKYYAIGNKTISVTVSLKDASVSVESEILDLNIGDTFTIIATTVPDDLDVTYVLDDSGVVIVDNSGVVTALKEGITSIVVKVGGDGIYAENSTTVTATVNKVDTLVTLSYNASAKEVVVGLYSIDGLSLSSTPVSVNIGGMNYIVKTNSHGMASLSVANLTPSSYVVFASYVGNNRFNPTNTTDEIIIQ